MKICQMEIDKLGEEYIIMAEPKTSEAMRKAIDKYDEKFDKTFIRFDKGTADRIKALGFSVNAYTRLAVAEKLAHDEEVLGKK